MQFHLLSAAFIFLGSYFPLALILALQDIPSSWWDKSLCSLDALSKLECDVIPFSHPGLAITFMLITGIAVFLACLALSKISHPHEVEVQQFKTIPNEIINYTFPYVVSFMGISYSEPQKLIGLTAFFIWMFVITYKSGQILMNPLLLVFNWRLYEATIKISGKIKEVRILFQGDLSLGELKAQTVQDFYILKEK